MKVVKKVWGEEHIVTNNEKYCGKVLMLKKGYQCSYHKHNVKDEVFLIFEGVVDMEVAGKKKRMSDYDTVRIKPGTFHRFTGITDVLMIEFSTPHSDDDVVRREESRRVS